MSIHKNAGTTPKMRALIVERHEAGETPRSLSSAIGVLPATIQKWIGRFKGEGVAGRSV
jgi:transposase